MVYKKVSVSNRKSISLRKILSMFSEEVLPLPESAAQSQLLEQYIRSQLLTFKLKQ
jgi:hypothetical protein